MKDLKMSLSQKSFVLILSGMSLALPQSIFAQNHNPEFKVSNTFLGGEPYILIGDDDEAVYPHRTPVELKYREEAPEGGITTLSWISGGDLVDSYDSENDTSGVIDGDGDGITGDKDGSWSWSDDKQPDDEDGVEGDTYEGKTIYLQGKTAADSGNTATLKASHDADPEGDAFEKEFTLLKVDVAVDNNRDGTIDFADAADETAEDQPFIFWVNSDSDMADDENADGTVPNYSDNVINGARDLEDFSRLHLDISTILELLKDDEIDIALKFDSVDMEGSPSIKIWEDIGFSHGDESYLKNSESAEDQLSGLYTYTDTGYLGEVTSSQLLVIPQEFWDNLTFSDDPAYLLYEGSGTGKGKLTIELQKDGQTIGDGPSVWLELKEVQAMYNYAVTAWNDEDSPWDYRTEQPPNSPPGYTDQTDSGFEAPWYENDELVVFTHGWARDNRSELNRIEMADVTFKRLWHLGFKGRFAYYEWETVKTSLIEDLANASLDQFSESEYRGYKYGTAFKNYVESFPSNFSPKIAAQSLGNIALSEAVKQGLSADFYAVIQAAVSASCYDTSEGLLTYPNRTTPDLASEGGYRGYFSGLNGTLTNFFSPNDEAWNFGGTSFWSGGWNLLQLNKPLENDIGTYVRYRYRETAPANERLVLEDQEPSSNFFRTVDHVHESLAFIARSRSEPLGGQSGVGSSISANVNVGAAPYNFGNAHNAMWLFDYQAVYEFYREFGNALDIDQKLNN